MDGSPKPRDAWVTGSTHCHAAAAASVTISRTRRAGDAGIGAINSIGARNAVPARMTLLPIGLATRKQATTAAT